MKIAIICGELEGGGVERVNTSLAKNFLKARHDVTYIVVTTKKETATKSNYPFKIICLESKSIKRSLFASISALKRLEPDIIMTSILDETFFALLYKHYYNRGTKIIYTQHTVWSTVCNLSKKGYFFNMIMPRVLKLFQMMDALVYVSRGVCDDMRKTVKGINTKEKVIYNPITSTNEFYRYKPIDKDHIQLVTAGRLSSEKRQDIIIRATKILIDRGVNTELYIYGVGDMEDYLKNLCRDLEIADKVHFMGFSHDLQSDMSKYDIFVLSSIYESFGNVIVEAMNTGLPVISTDCPVGPRELLDHGKYGILIPMNDPKKMAESVIQLVDTSCEKSVWDSFNRSMCFSVENSIRQYEKLFKELRNK